LGYTKSLPVFYVRLVFEYLADGCAESVPVNASVREGFGDYGLEFAEAVFGQCEGGAEFKEGHGLSPGMKSE